MQASSDRVQYVATWFRHGSHMVQTRQEVHRTQIFSHAGLLCEVWCLCVKYRPRANMVCVCARLLCVCARSSCVRGYGVCVRGYCVCEVIVCVRDVQSSQPVCVVSHPNTTGLVFACHSYLPNADTMLTLMLTYFHHGGVVCSYDCQKSDCLSLSLSLRLRLTLRTRLSLSL